MMGRHSRRSVAALAAMSALVLGLAAACSSPTTTPTTTAPATSKPATTSPATSNPATTSPATSAPAASTVTCAYPASGQAAKPATSPATNDIPNSGTVIVTLHMDAGDVEMALDRSGAPCAVNSLVSLAGQKYYDDTSCHRLVPNFVLQCGDPSGTGSGGPGYRFADELSGKEKYTYGTVAMANAGPNTNGSQFFIVIGTNVALGPQYTVLGKVTDTGMKVVDAIAAKGVANPSDPNSIKPAEGGHIATVTVDQ